MTMLIGGSVRIGDAVMSLPAVTALVRSFSDSRCIMLAPGASAGVYKFSGLPVRVLSCPAGGLALLRFFRRLRREEAKKAVLLSGGFIWALGARLAGIPERIGLDSDNRGRLLTVAVPPDEREIHQTESCQRIAVAAGAAVSADAVPRLVVPADAVSGLSTIIPEPFLKGRYCTVAPGASRAGKRWPPERFIGISRVLVSEGLHCVVLGSLRERRLVEAISAAAGERVLPAVGLPLETVIPLLAGSVFHIGNNSGLSHLAAALGIRTLCISGPSNPAKSGPKGEGVFHLGGSPVTGRESRYRVHPALEAVTSVDVLEVVRNQFLL